MSEPDSRLKIKKKDLEDEDLFLVNKIIGDLYSRIDSTRNSGRFAGNAKFEHIEADIHDGTPSPNDVVPFGTIQRYFSPQAVRESLVYRSWLGTPIRPLASSDIPFNQSSLAISIVNTHALRLTSYPAASYDVGTFYYETDRDALYQTHLVAGVNQWVWIGGTMRSAFATRPTDLSVNDEGFIFVSTDTFYTFRWDGSAWVIVPVYTDSSNVARTSVGESLASYHGATPTDAVGFTSRRSRGTPTSPTNVQVGDRLGFFALRGYRGSDYWASFFIDSYVASLPTADRISSDTFIYTTDSAGNSARRWAILGDGHIRPDLGGTYDFGDATYRVRDISAESIDLNTGFTLSPGATAGYVLTSDSAGVGTWQPSGGSSIPYKISRCSSTLNLTTSYVDVPGCSLSLDRDGDWEIIGVFVGFKSQNDSQVGGRLDNDGTAEPGIATYGLNILYDGYYTITNTWIITISGQPKTVKLQATKIGTGTSWVQLTDTVISAKFLG
jgi:hypothetical protein